MADYEEEGLGIIIISSGEGANISLNRTEAKKIRSFIDRWLKKVIE